MSKRKTYDEFITEYISKWGVMKYSFDRETYINMNTPMRVICSKHGEFWKTPKNILKYDCIKCSYEERGKQSRLTNEIFIEKAIKVHGNKYDYSKVDYCGTKKPVVIVCPKHGEFMQKPNDHLSGKGCKLCNESHLEKKIKKFLEIEGITYTYQYHPEWLGRQSIDFFIPSLNIGIECQGKQHFGYGGWSKDFDFQKLYLLDNKKYEKCIMCGIKMIYVIDDNVNYIYPKEINYTKDIVNFKNFKKCITKRV